MCYSKFFGDIILLFAYYNDYVCYVPGELATNSFH